MGSAKGDDHRDVALHGAELLALAPILYHDLHASLNASQTTGVMPGSHDRCYSHRVEGYGNSVSPFRTEVASTVC